MKSTAAPTMYAPFDMASTKYLHIDARNSEANPVKAFAAAGRIPENLFVDVWIMSFVKLSPCRMEHACMSENGTHGARTGNTGDADPSPGFPV